MNELDRLRAAAHRPDECHPECKCLCHDSDVEDPGDHLKTCAWADPDFPEYVWDERMAAKRKDVRDDF